MFGSLTEKFTGIISKLRFKPRFTEKNVRDAHEDVHVALRTLSPAGDVV